VNSRPAVFPFPSLTMAQRAYDALRDRGVTPQQMELRVMDDEAGHLQRQLHP
jgi:hypothetical protein